MERIMGYLDLLNQLKDVPQLKSLPASSTPALRRGGKPRRRYAEGGSEQSLRQLGNSLYGQNIGYDPSLANTADSHGAFYDSSGYFHPAMKKGGRMAVGGYGTFGPHTAGSGDIFKPGFANRPNAFSQPGAMKKGGRMAFGGYGTPDWVDPGFLAKGGATRRSGKSCGGYERHMNGEHPGRSCARVNYESDMKGEKPIKGKSW